jgi:hypothetical protein
LKVALVSATETVLSLGYVLVGKVGFSKGSVVVCYFSGDSYVIEVSDCVIDK